MKIKLIAAMLAVCALVMLSGCGFISKTIDNIDPSKKGREPVEQGLNNVAAAIIISAAIRSIF